MSKTLEREQRKRRLMAKIEAERKLIDLHGRQLWRHAQPSALRTKLLQNTGSAFAKTAVARALFRLVQSHPALSLSTVKMLMRGLKQPRSGVLRDLALTAATWYVSSRKAVKARKPVTKADKVHKADKEHKQQVTPKVPGRPSKRRRLLARRRRQQPDTTA